MRWFYALLGAIPVLIICLAIGIIGNSLLKSSYQHKLDDQKKDMQAECAADKTITKGISDAYETNISAFDSRLASLRLRFPPNVLPSAPSAASRHATPGPAKPLGQCRIDPSAVLDIAALGERYRLQLKSCQDFILKTWQANGQ